MSSVRLAVMLGYVAATVEGVPDTAGSSEARAASGVPEAHDHPGSGVPLVAHVLTRPNLGGVARAVVDLALRLPPRFLVRVIAGTAPPEEGEIDPLGVPIERVPLVRPPRPAHDLVVLARLRSALSGSAVVHTHMAKAGALGRLAAASLRPRPAIVHTYHGHVLEGYFGRVASRAFLATERSLARVSDALVAVSDEVRDDLLALGIGRPEQWHVIPLGVDLGRFEAVLAEAERKAPGALRERAGLGASLEGPVLGGVLGRLVPVKDHATLLRALAALDGAHDVHLAVLGEGELKGELKALAARLGVAGRVHFVGWWDDIAGAMADLDFVVSSSTKEGTPMALIEAAAAARAVVATDVGGVRSVVEDGRTGLLVAPGDPAALAGAIGELARDPRRRASLGAAARLRVAERFGMDRFVEAHAALYASLLGRSGQPG